MLAKNPGDRNKHVRYNFVRDHLLKKVYDLAYIPTKSQLADIFTKILLVPVHRLQSARLQMN